MSLSPSSGVLCCADPHARPRPPRSCRSGHLASGCWLQTTRETSSSTAGPAHWMAGTTRAGHGGSQADDMQAGAHDSHRRPQLQQAPVMGMHIKDGSVRTSVPWAFRRIPHTTKTHTPPSRPCCPLLAGTWSWSGWRGEQRSVCLMWRAWTHQRSTRVRGHMRSGSGPSPLCRSQRAWRHSCRYEREHCATVLLAWPGVRAA